MLLRIRCFVYLLIVVALGSAVWTADGAGVAVDAPNDAVMATRAELEEMANWASQVFAKTKRSNLVRCVELEVRRQDHNVLRFGQSCMETPIRVKDRDFTHGLGTHANSEIAVAVPPGAEAFKAMVGIDNNYDTQGIRGSVQFVVEVAGTEVFRTPTLRGPDDPFFIDVAIGTDDRQLVLKVETTDDGPSHDQADWADAHFVMADGDRLWLDQNQSELLTVSTDPPFSFLYGGTPSAELLPTWTHQCTTTELDDRVEYHSQWTDPKTSLCVSVVASVFRRYPAVDWVISFENRGGSDTPILESIQAMDVRLRTGLSSRPAVLHQLHGDFCGELSFRPTTTDLESGQEIHIAPNGGRPSNGAFPFFNFQYADQGLIAAIGWSGQWAASFERAPTGPTRMQAGMETTHLVLHPGESIRSPRILLMPWTGDRITAHNRFRRLLLFHYVPQEDGKPVHLPAFMQCFDRYSWTRPEWATEAGQCEAARWARDLGCTAHWFDAAWFVGGFPNGVGNWYCKPEAFPRGLKPVAEACHEQDLDFVVWFEPERVAKDSQIAREHPEFVFGGVDGGLFKLSDPAARKWLTDLLSQRITEFDLDWYRNDFNIDPLSFWRANDPPDRQGITEIRYVEGHYAMWDELRARHPGLLIDNCASGGRRIDLETCMRSVPLWRSDTSCSPGHPDWNQSQTCGLSLYLPLHTACGWTPEPYDFRSSATAGAISQWDYLDANFPRELARQTIAEAKENGKYWYGDFYPLTSCGIEPDEFVAYQFHRADLDAGLVLAFRRTECRYLGLVLGLQAVDPEKTYSVEFINEARDTLMKTMTGRELSTDLVLRIPEQPGSLLVRYKRAQTVDGQK